MFQEWESPSEDFSYLALKKECNETLLKLKEATLASLRDAIAHLDRPDGAIDFPL